jgi:hypothetical protein
MSMDRMYCAICAWRRDCKKKFSSGDSFHCPDFTKDLTIRDRKSSQQESHEQEELASTDSDLLD